MAESKMLAPNVTLWWVPAAGVTDYTAITVAQINAGVNLSCAVVKGYTLNPTDSDTDSTQSVCDSANVDNFTKDNYEGQFSFFRSDLVSNTAVFTSAHTAFKKPDATGFWVERLGKGNAAVAAVGDEVSVYGFTSDWPRVEFTDENGGPILESVKFLPTAQINQNFTLTA